MSKYTCLYTMGKWSIYVKPDCGHGSVDLYVDKSDYSPQWVSEGFIRDGWFRRSIRSAWNIAMKNVNRNHKKDLEAQAGMEMATNIADNWLSEPQIEKLLEEVLAPSSNG